MDLIKQLGGYEKAKAMIEGQPDFRYINMHTKEFEHIPDFAPCGNYTHCKSVWDIRNALLKHEKQNAVRE